MPPTFFPPPPPKPLFTCNRCGLQSPKEAGQCTHCAGLSDAKLRSYLEQHEQEKVAGSHLGRYLIVAAVIVLALTLITML